MTYSEELKKLNQIQLALELQTHSLMLHLRSGNWPSSIEEHKEWKEEKSKIKNRITRLRDLHKAQYEIVQKTKPPNLFQSAMQKLRTLTACRRKFIW